MKELREHRADINSIWLWFRAIHLLFRPYGDELLKFQLRGISSCPDFQHLQTLFSRQCLSLISLDSRCRVMPQLMPLPKKWPALPDSWGNPLPPGGCRNFHYFLYNLKLLRLPLALPRPHVVFLPHKHRGHPHPTPFFSLNAALKKSCLSHTLWLSPLRTPEHV